MNMREIEAQAKALAPVFGKLLEQAKSALRDEFKEQIAERDQRIAELEKSVSERPYLESIAKMAADLIPSPKDGLPGKDANVAELKEHLDELVKALPIPEPGKDADMEALKEHIDCAVKDAAAYFLEGLPAPKDGQSITADDVRPLLAELVGDAVKALPAAEPGKDADMEALRAHLDGLVKGIEPAAAPSVDEVAATFERRFSDLTLSWERQARDTFEKAADRMPAPKDGRDALPLDSFDLTLGDDGRTVTVKMMAGETVVEKSVKIPAVIDRGVFGPDKEYEQGDGATYGGCYWIAQKDAPEGVPGSSADWRLAVKKGRDGKDLRDSASKHDPSKGVKIRKEGDDK